jgi:hypothetical protein
MINCCVGSGDLGVSNIGERPSDSPRALLCTRASSTKSRNGSGATVKPSRCELRARPRSWRNGAARASSPCLPLSDILSGTNPDDGCPSKRVRPNVCPFLGGEWSCGRTFGRSICAAYARHPPTGELRFGVSATKVHAPLAVISFAISFAALSASSMPSAMEKITSCSVSFAPLRPPSGPRSDRRVNVTLDSLR